MAGLGVVLESHKNFNQSRRHQIISKTTLVSSTQYNFSSPSSSHNSPMASLCTSSFLQRCFLCHKELKDGMDIYMYRGDRAFCSAECRCRHIFADEDGGKNFAYLLS